MAERRDDANDVTPTHGRGAAVATWVWIPALVVIGIVVWLVVRALS